jgi:hypothetical protein
VRGNASLETLRQRDDTLTRRALFLFINWSSSGPFDDRYFLGWQSLPLLPQSCRKPDGSGIAL